MQTQTLEYQADGLNMKGHLALPASQDGRRPGVLVFPEAFGLSAHAKQRAERLAAELGYVALAGDLHGEQYQTKGMEEALGLIGQLREAPARLRARAQGALHALLARPEVDPARIGAMGYCFGGTMALELARSGAKLAGAVGFHSGLATKNPHDAKAITGKVLVCIGADDPMIDAAQRAAFEAEMKQSGVNWQMSIYGGVVHSFTNPEADHLNKPEAMAYNKQADARSWAEMRTLFGEVFGR